MSRDTGPFEAKFTAAATAASDELEVTIPGWDDGEHPFGPVVWQPGPNGQLPAEDDRALVSRSDDGFWWVLSWVPADPDTWPVLRVIHGAPAGGEPPGWYVDVDSEDMDVYEVMA